MSPSPECRVTRWNLCAASHRCLRELSSPVCALHAGGLHQLLHGAWYGQRWSREGLPARTAHLVLDEADALLGGGFRDHTDRILEVGPLYFFVLLINC